MTRVSTTAPTMNSRISDSTPTLGRRGVETRVFEFEVYLRPHGMRHTFATILLEEKGVDVRKVQLALRHKSLDTTTSTYLHDEPPRTFVPI